MLETRVLLLLFLSSSLSSSVSVARKPQTIKRWTIQMTGYSPMKNDDYVAVAMEAPTGYIVGYEPLANADRVHHMLLYGCMRPYAQTFWRGEMTCGGGPTHILYAWARNAPNLDLPKGVGFAIGEASGNSAIKYLVLQVHYAAPFGGNIRDYSGVTLKVAEDEPANLAAVFLLVSGSPIPPLQKQFQNNMSCTYAQETVLHPFAFRTHTHKMGRVVSAFYKRESTWTMVGKRNPQWPQLFEPIKSELEIRKGDFIAGSCRFDSSNTTEITPMGSMGSNEMCNFYMMVYWKASDEHPFPYGAVCSGSPPHHSMDDYPREGTDLLPPHPELEHHAHQSAVPFGIIEEARVHSIGTLQLGQISGLAFDKSNHLVVFHRGSRVWNQNTFTMDNRLRDPTPINEDTVVVLEWKGANATIVSRMGKGQFFLPHGIFVDEDGSIYVTDVGSHTVSKYTKSNGNLVRVWETGEHLVPGSDSSHFCKPTAITRIGDSLFVSDGYCNSRVVELTMDGKYKNSFGSPHGGDFSIVHDVVAKKDTGELIVADRENGRVFELRTDGTLVSLLTSTLFNNIYSVDVLNDYIFMIPGEFRASQFGGDELPIAVFVGKANTGLVEYAFAPTSGPFSRPHVVRVCPHGDHIFVGDISDGSSVLWKFKVQHEGSNSEDSLPSPVFSLPFSSSQSFSPFILFILSASTIAVIAFVIKKRLSKEASQDSFNRKGFKPLRMEEALLSSDESDLD